MAKSSEQVLKSRAVVVAQLVERSLPIPEVRTPSSAKIYIEYFTANCIEKTKIKKDSPGKAHFKKSLNVTFKLALTILHPTVFTSYLLPLEQIY